MFQSSIFLRVKVVKYFLGKFIAAIQINETITSFADSLWSSRFFPLEKEKLNYLNPFDCYNNDNESDQENALGESLILENKDNFEQALGRISALLESKRIQPPLSLGVRTTWARDYVGTFKFT